MVLTLYLNDVTLRGEAGALFLSLLKIVADVTHETSITRILDHVGLSPPEQEKPPPRRDVVRVPVDDEGREIQAS